MILNKFSSLDSYTTKLGQFKTLKKLHFLFLSLPALFFIFHHLINQDFRFLGYDSESDYIFNALHILEYKIPLGYAHPGTFLYYFVSVVLRISQIFELNFFHTVLLIRSILISNLLFFIALFLNSSFSKFNRYFFLILAIPKLDLFLGIICTEIFLFPVSIMLIRLIKKEKVNNYLIGIIIALGLSIKLSFILLFPVILLYLFAKKKNVVYYLKIFITFIIIFGILILPALPAFLSHYKSLVLSRVWDISHFLGLDSGYKLALLFILSLSFFVFTLIRYRLIISHFLTNNYQLISFYYSSILIIISLIISSIVNFEFMRHVIPLIPVIIECGFKTKINYNKKYEYAIHILLIIILLINKQKINYNEYTEFDQFVNENDDKIILAFQDNSFHSEYLFREWGQSRYANSDTIWPQRWKTKYNVQFLNTRNQECTRVPSWAEVSIFNKWYLDRELIATYYRPCIIDQLKRLEKGDAVLTTFYKEEGDMLKPVLLKFGYEMYPKAKFDNFTVWEVQNSIVFPKN